MNEMKLKKPRGERSSGRQGKIKWERQRNIKATGRRIKERVLRGVKGGMKGGRGDRRQ